MASEAPARAAAAGPKVWLVLLSLMALVCLAYTPAFRAGTIWDDNEYVIQNANLRDVAGLVRTWTQPHSLPQYYPMVHTFYWLEHQIWGVHPTGYHVVNVLLHALSAFLLWLAVRRLKLPGALAAAILFAVHPVAVESVAWITERKNTLSLAFALSAMLAYLQFDDLGAQEPRARRWGWYPLALLLFVAALLSKTVTATLAGVLVVLIWWKRGRVRLVDVAAVAPFWIVGGSLGWMTAHLEQVRVGAAGRDWAIAPIDRVLIAGRAIVFYAGKIIFPYQLTFIYPRWRIDSTVWWQYLFPAAVLALVVALWLARRRIGRGPLAGLLCFIGILFPALGFFNVYPMRYSWVADHFQYHASVAMIALLAGLGAAGWARLPESFRRSGPPLGFAAVLALAGTTFLQCMPYFNAVTLWKDTIAKNPRATIAYFNLADLASQAGRHEEALGHMRAATEATPEDPVAWANYASVLDRAGRFDDAMAASRRAIGLYRKPEPELGSHHFGLARLLVKTGRWVEAEGEFRKALAAGFTAPEVYEGLGLALTRLGRPEQAIEPLALAAERGSGSPSTFYNLGTALHAAGRMERAASAYRRALALDPSYLPPRNNLALLLHGLGRTDEAIQELSIGLRIKPDDPRMMVTMGLLLGSRQRSQEAIAILRRAVALAPQMPVALSTLAQQLATRPGGTAAERAEAVELARRASDAMQGRDPTLLDTLATAQAAAGDRVQAAATARRAADLADAAGQGAMAKSIRERAAGYAGATRPAPR